jgi:hypothetical protein
MPFKIVKEKRGFRVVDDKGNFYSKTSLTKARATAQLRALYASYSRGESVRGSGYATYCDEDGHHHLLLQGSGFFSDIWTKVKVVANKVAKVFSPIASNITAQNLQTASDLLAVGVRQDYPPNVRDVLAQYGAGQVYALTLYREPVKAYIDTVMNILSVGSWNAAKTRLNYDKMFHLSLVASLAMPSGDKIHLKIEKNEVINVTPELDIAADAEKMEVPVGCCITLQQMMAKAQQAAGSSFFTYDAFTNNCQKFIITILRANNLDNPTVSAFVLQNAEDLAKQLPTYVRPFASTVTNLAGFWNRLYRGQGEFDARGHLKGGRVYCVAMRGGADLPPRTSLTENAPQDLYGNLAAVQTAEQDGDVFGRDVAVQGRQQAEAAAKHISDQSGALPPTPKCEDVTTLNNWNEVPAGYTGFIKVGRCVEDKDTNWRGYNIAYYKDGALVRDGLTPGSGASKYLFNWKAVEESWNRYSPYDPTRPPDSAFGDESGDPTKTVRFDNQGREVFDVGKHASVEWLNSVEGRHRRELDPVFEELYQRVLEQDHSLKNRTADQIVAYEKKLEDDYQQELRQRYGDNEDIYSPEADFTLTNRSGVQQRVHKVRLRQDGGYDIQFGDGTYEYQPGRDEWDCNEWTKGDDIEDYRVCGQEARKKAADQKESNIRRNRDRQWDESSGWDKFVNGINVAGRVTSDYILPVVSNIASVLPGGQVLSNALDFASDLTGQLQEGHCRDYNECTDTMVSDGRDRSLYHRTKGDSVAERYLTDENWQKLLEKNEKAYGLVRDTYNYGSRAGKFATTGEGKPDILHERPGSEPTLRAAGDKRLLRYNAIPRFAEADLQRRGIRQGPPIHPRFKRQLLSIGFSPEQYLRLAREFAEDAGYDSRALQFSDDDKHKLMIYDDNGTPHRFGAVGYNDYLLWSKKEALKQVPTGYADRKRRTFNKSHRAIGGDWAKDPYSPNSLALLILW